MVPFRRKCMRKHHHQYYRKRQFKIFLKKVLIICSITVTSVNIVTTRKAHYKDSSQNRIPNLGNRNFLIGLFLLLSTTNKKQRHYEANSIRKICISKESSHNVVSNLESLCPRKFSFGINFKHH